MMLCCWHAREPPRKSGPAVTGLSGGLEDEAPLCYSPARSVRTLRRSTNLQKPFGTAVSDE